LLYRAIIIKKAKLVLNIFTTESFAYKNNILCLIEIFKTLFQMHYDV